MRRKQPYIIIIALSFLLLGSLGVNDTPSTRSERIVSNEQLKLLDHQQDMENVEEINYLEDIESSEHLEVVEEVSITSFENTRRAFLVALHNRKYQVRLFSILSTVFICHFDLVQGKFNS